MKLFKIFTCVIVVLFSLSVSGQPVSSYNDNHSKIYVKIYGAYGFLSPGSFKGKSELITNEPIAFHVAKTGTGAGLRTGAGIGFIINEFINIGIDGEYLFGKKINLNENITSAQSSQASTSGYSLEAKRTFEHEVVSVIPNIVFKAISKPNYYVYNRLGVVFGIPLKITESYFQHYHWKTITPNVFLHTLGEKDINVTYNGKYTLRPSVGYQFSLGTQVLLTEKLRGFLEFTAYSISFNRNKYEDNSRLRTQVDTNKGEVPKPTVFDNSKYIFEYINSGTTGTNIKGVPNDYLTTVRYAQDPVIMNAITAGLGFAYRF